MAQATIKDIKRILKERKPEDFIKDEKTKEGDK